MSKTFEPQGGRRRPARARRGARGRALLVCSPLLVLSALALRAPAPAASSTAAPASAAAASIFTMLKFRTLKPEAEARIGRYSGIELTRMTADEQTRVGHILRATKLDELPQLWNVLRGEMSIVGPRPIRPRFFEELARDIPGYWQRLVVRPGITGFAQLRLTRDMTWAEKLAHDFEYIADRCVRLYLEIVAETAWLVLARPRAAATCRSHVRDLRHRPRATGAPSTRALLGAMSDALRHRGPDSAGEVVLGEAGLAARRLAIIDLEGGDQPIANEDGRIVVVQNGEIYNHAELRAELEAAGHRFRTPHSDTEVLVHLYEQHGAALRRAAAGHVRGRGVGRASGAGSCSRATASGSSRSTTATAADFAFASELKALRRAAGPLARGRPRRARGLPRLQRDPRAADDLPRGPQAAARPRAGAGGGRGADRALRRRAAGAGAPRRAVGGARRRAARAPARLRARAPRRRRPRRRAALRRRRLLGAGRAGRRARPRVDVLHRLRGEVVLRGRARAHDRAALRRPTTTSWSSSPTPPSCCRRSRRRSTSRSRTRRRSPPTWSRSWRPST